jgi:hypothetical protein
LGYRGYRAVTVGALSAVPIVGILAKDALNGYEAAGGWLYAQGASLLTGNRDALDCWERSNPTVTNPGLVSRLMSSLF